MKANLEEKSIALNVSELVTWLLCRRFGAETDTGAGSVLENLEDTSEEITSLLPEGEEVL